MAKKNAVNAEVGKMMSMGRIPCIAVFDTMSGDIFPNLESFLEEAEVFQDKPLNEKKRRKMTQAACGQIADYRLSGSGMTKGDPRDIFSQNVAFVATLDDKTQGVRVNLVRKEKAEEAILPRKIQSLMMQFNRA